ncbi:MAG: beta-lactamase family protein [Lachnospiraceae bacterium]|nr:beta-lactamase family protein [Lachnospiraceae bacterium]
MDKKEMFESLFRDAYEKGVFNGTWLYAENGRVVSKGAMGYRDRDDKLAMQEDSIFELASISKQFTASAVMLLVRDGLLCLDDEVTKFFPEIHFPGVTIRHLLTHTGGIPETYDDNLIMGIYQDEKRIPESDVVIRFLADDGTEPCFAPGEQFEYTNGGYNLLAEIVEKISGVPFEDFLKTRIFEPAGMHATGIYHLGIEGIPGDNFVCNMVLGDGGYITVDESEDGDVMAFNGLNGDDYVYTDIFDMLAWDRALREEKALTLDEQKIMYTPGKLNDGSVSGSDENTDGYGFGWGIKNDPDFGLIVSHSGGMPGLNTWYWRFVDSDRVMVLLNCREQKDARASFGLWKGVQEIAKDREPEPVRSIEDIMIKDPDRSKWESYCGKYEHPEDGELIIDEIFMKDDLLYARTMDEDEEGPVIRLYPIGENEFGIKNGWVTISFSDTGVTYDGRTCRKVRNEE